LEEQTAIFNVILVAMGIILLKLVIVVYIVFHTKKMRFVESYEKEKAGLKLISEKDRDISTGAEKINDDVEKKVEK
jgi:hypothetical protein